MAAAVVGAALVAACVVAAGCGDVGTDFASGVAGVARGWASESDVAWLVSRPDSTGTGALIGGVGCGPVAPGLGGAVEVSFSTGVLVRSSAAARSATLTWPASSLETESATPALVDPACVAMVCEFDVGESIATLEAASNSAALSLDDPTQPCGSLVNALASARSRSRRDSSSRAKSDAPRALSARLRSATDNASEVDRVFETGVFEDGRVDAESVMEKMPGPWGRTAPACAASPATRLPEPGRLSGSR